MVPNVEGFRVVLGGVEGQEEPTISGWWIINLRNIHIHTGDGSGRYIQQAVSNQDIMDKG